MSALGLWLQIDLLLLALMGVAFIWRIHVERREDHKETIERRLKLYRGPL